jgi:hypothetical protein
MVTEQRKNGAVARCHRQPLIESPLFIQLILRRRQTRPFRKGSEGPLSINPEQAPDVRLGKLEGLTYDTEGTLDSVSTFKQCSCHRGRVG